MTDANWHVLAGSWSFSPLLVAWLVLVGATYLYGWARLRKRVRKGVKGRGWANSFGRQSSVGRFGWGRLACFQFGLVVLFVTLQSPVDALASFSLLVHMIQHLMLMIAVPLLLLFGRPMIPLIAGLPVRFRREWFQPFATWPPLRRFLAFVFQPVVCWSVFVVIMWGWHTPAAYELALGNPFWHRMEHFCFLTGSLLFWFPVVRPYPYVPRWSTWSLLPYLFLAGVQGTALAGMLTFSDSVVYPHYARVPNLFGQSALADQGLAGATMWVPTSIAYLIALVLVVGEKFYCDSPDFESRGQPEGASQDAVCPVPSPALSLRMLPSGDEAADLVALASVSESTGELASRFSFAQVIETGTRCDRSSIPRPENSGVALDAAREALAMRPAMEAGPASALGASAPVHHPVWTGDFLRSATCRSVLRVALGLVALCVVADGLLGPQVAPVNLAGVLPWIHWRGLLLIALVLGGNFFCMVCPFTAFSRLIRWLWSRAFHVLLKGRVAGRVGSANLEGASSEHLPRGFTWPGFLRNKWAAIGLLVLFFWSYEAFALWDRPRATAWIVIGYFAAALVLSLVYRDAPFCKYVCPIGQFNFVQSLFSPSQVAAVSSSVCAGCATRDCIADNRSTRGCELHLFLPQKSGNMDCTFCMDCSDACPHGNVALTRFYPLDDVAMHKTHSGVGRFDRRFDIAVLIGLLFSAALVNAAWMTSPVLALEDQWVAYFSIGRLPTITVGMLVALCGVPLGIFVLIAWLSRWADSRPSGGLGEQFSRYAVALVPLGVGMWTAHYTFHLVTSWDSAWIAGRRAFSQMTGSVYEVVPVACNCCRADSIEWLLPLEFLFLAIGMTGSVICLLRISENCLGHDRGNALAPGVASPWGYWRRMLPALAPWLLLLLGYYLACLWVVLQPMQMRGAGG